MLRIGKIVATHGLNGAVKMTHILETSDWLKKGQALMVEMRKGSMIPWFVADCNPAGDGVYNIILEELNTVEEAKKLVSKSVYVEESILETKIKDLPLLWIGFKMNDLHLGNIGVIDDVFQSTNQWLGKVEHNGSEVLVPLISQFIKQVNVKNKWILVELPEGFLEVFTG